VKKVQVDELQPLDKSFFKSLKSNCNEAVHNYRRQHPRRPLGKLKFLKLFTQAQMSAGSPSIAVSGFRFTRIYPYNPNIISETFAPNNVSGQPVEKAPPTLIQKKT
jgi:hypothetical protein